MGRGQSGLASDDAPNRHAEGCNALSHSALAATAELNRQRKKVSLIRPARRISADRRRAQGTSHVAQHKMRASTESSQVLETPA